MNFNFFMPVRVISGENAISVNAAEFVRFGKRCLIITGGKSAILSGALEDVTSALESHDIAYSVFNNVTQNPYISTAHEAGKAAREFDADFIIGIGGGSALDCSKAAAIYAANDELEPIDIYSLKFKKKALPIILVGTTAGTGSELTAVSVMTIDETNRKKSITHPYCFAKISFADPKYTHSAPRSVTVSTALDALSHATEGWFSPRITDIPIMFAEKGLSMLWASLKYLDSSTDTPSPELRERLYYGSLYAGAVLNACGTAYPHPLGYVLTEDFSLPHGRACTVYLPSLVRRGMKYAPEKADEFFEILNTDIDEFTDIVTRLTNAEHIHMTSEQIDAYASRWVGLKNFKNVPGGFSAEEAKALLQKLFLD